MNYKILYSKKFKKHFDKLSKNEQKQTIEKLKIFSEDIFHPSLRSKRFRGIEGVWETSINMDLRILWQFDGKELIIVIDIGHHDILYKY